MTRSKLEDVAPLILRLTFGGLMAFLHGLGKLQSALAGSTQFADPIGLGPGPSLWLAAFAEAGCGALLVLGIATRAAALPLAFTMSVAVFVQHAADPLAKKELGLVYLAAYASLLLLGPGRFALSSLYAKKLPKNKALRWLLA
jgi:putative oxidoreductase